MAPAMETIMVLKVDLQCPRCYKKVKKVLCQFPHVRDQLYDDKQNTVTIKVVCCSPEKIRDKICIKGGKSIHSIEIKEPPKPKPSAPAPQGGEKPPKPSPQPAKPSAEKPKDTPAPGKNHKNGSGPKPVAPAKPPEKAPDKPDKPDAKPAPAPKHPPGIYPVHVCCGPCFEGRPGGPCYERPQPVCDPYAYYGYGGGWHSRPGYYVSRCDYFSEENPQSCVLM